MRAKRYLLVTIQFTTVSLSKFTKKYRLLKAKVTAKEVDKTKGSRTLEYQPNTKEQKRCATKLRPAARK
jgi:hypothetical protein